MPEQNTFIWISVFAISAMVINSIGIWAVYKYKEKAEEKKEYFMCFAAGVLITSPLIIAFPEASSKTSYAGLAALIGFVFMFYSNKLIKHLTKQKELAFGITAIEGIGIHSFIDGIIYTVTFSTGIMAGLGAGIGLAMHEFAEGVIAFTVLLKSGLSQKKSLAAAFIIAALTTPVGAFAAYPIVSRLDDASLGLALGFVAGVMIYISASHLLPEVREHEKKHSNIAFLAGVVLSLLIYITQRGT